MHRDSTWGASIHIKMAFRDRSRFVLSTRNLIADVCAEYLEPSENTSHIIMATNELLENIVKYSSGCLSSVEFDLSVKHEQPTVRIFTQNAASKNHLVDVESLLSR